jgi:hypothetical protein
MNLQDRAMLPYHGYPKPSQNVTGKQRQLFAVASDGAGPRAAK